MMTDHDLVEALKRCEGRRTEISDLYIAASCRNFGIDLEDFKAKL